MSLTDQEIDKRIKEVEQKKKDVVEKHIPKAKRFLESMSKLAKHEPHDIIIEELNK